MPKVHRGGGSTGLLRSHSRSSSSSKLGGNLQFTQKDLPPPKVTDKHKKPSYIHETHPKAVTSFARANSSQRVQSREQVQPFVLKREPTPHNNHKTNGVKLKSGFTISSPGDGDDDEDQWVSSESGVVTPNHMESDSDSSSDAHTPNEETNRPTLPAQNDTRTAWPENTARPHTSSLPRVDTARQSDFSISTLALDTAAAVPLAEEPGACTPTSPAPLPHPELPAHAGHHQSQDRPQFDQDMIHETRSEIAESSRPGSRPASKRYSVTRPPSTHSVSSRGELRPHPLIRGNSFGQALPPKPVPLMPLTVISDTVMPSSPPSSIHSGTGNQSSTSPSSSLRTTLASPTSLDRITYSQRRTSISSARSATTLPGVRETPHWGMHDRTRAVSTISHSSSSAALSSLAHLPTVTRPPSPQSISFFPPVNPHANIEGIHPLLPAPYLNNHLTVLARRTPIRESYDRVMRAKQVRP